MYLILDSNDIPWVFEVYLQSKNMNFRVGFSQFEYQETCFMFYKNHCQCACICAKCHCLRVEIAH